VWRDINGNGIQDPLELGIMDVEIELYADFNKDSLPDGAVLAYAITDANGKFVFNSTNVSDGDPSTSGNQPGLLSYRTYLLRIGPSDWSGGTGTNDSASHGLSLTHNAGSGQGYVRDNDAMVYMGVPTIFVSLNKDGQNDYDQDFGFNACKPIQLSDQFLNCNTPSIIIGPTPVSGSTYTWLPPTGLNNSGIAQPIASPTTTTTYTLTIDHVCPVTLTVYVDETPPPVNAGQDKMITCDDTLAMLGSPAQTGITYQWNPPTGLSDPTIAQPIAQPNATTVYTLTATGENGCVSTDEVTVTRNLCCAKITVPNIFSPNQDNLNDYFGIIEIKHVSQFKLLVFNRFGEEVFRTETKDIKWDGRFRGKDCDVGTYFYLLQYDCADTKSKEILKGDINLVR
jgi:gliding motility-associated-like protein